MIQARNTTLRGIDIPSTIKRKEISLDPHSRALRVGNETVFNLDLSSIFEAMAFAQEHLTAANRAAGISPFQMAGSLGSRRIQEELARSLNADATDASILNYTFPFLMLLQSGYQFTEAILLVGILAFFSLMTQFSVPSLPEVGVQQDVKFGTMCTDVFIRLLLGTCDDSLLPIINRLGSSQTDSLLRFGDAILDAVQAPNLTDGIAFFRKVTTPHFFGHGNLEEPANKWMKRICDVANGFHQNASLLSASDGSMFVLNPIRHIVNAGLGSVIYLKEEIAYTG
jgi:hypothetical protein